MTFQEIKNLDEQYVMHSYSRFPVALDRGKGATLWGKLKSGLGWVSLDYCKKI